jgi:fermentation-respiration switch protein FrsA (DUF1100 family)
MSVSKRAPVTFAHGWAPPSIPISRIARGFVAARDGAVIHSYRDVATRQAERMNRRRLDAGPGQPYLMFGLVLAVVIIAAYQYGWTATVGEWLAGLFEWA